MTLFSKKKFLQAMEGRKQDLSFMFKTLSSELTDTEKKIENISYQIQFFGSTSELKKEKEDCEIILDWIQNQFDEIKKSLFEINTHQISQKI